MSHDDTAATPPIRVAHVMTSARTLLFLTDHIKAIQSESVEYHVVANFNDTKYTADGERFHHVGLNRSLFKLGDFRATVQVYRMLKRINPDVIISSTPKAGLIGGAVGAMFFRKRRRIFLVRGFRFPTLTGFKRWLVRTMEIMPARFSKMTLATSPQTAEMMREMLPQRYHDRIGVTLNGTANGIDTDRFSPDNPSLASATDVRARFGISAEAFLILIVGRVCVDKGFVELAKAFERLKDRHPHVELLIVGDNDPTDLLSSDMQQRLDAIAIRAGRVDNDKIPEVFRAADLLVYPSHREGFGISAIEAAAMETPTVATRVGGLQSAVAEDVSGVFHPLGDVDAMYQWYNHFVENPEELSRLSASSRQHVVNRYDRRLYDMFWLRIFRGENMTEAPAQDERYTKKEVSR